MTQKKEGTYPLLHFFFVVTEKALPLSSDSSLYRRNHRPDNLLNLLVRH